MGIRLFCSASFLLLAVTVIGCGNIVEVPDPRDTRYRALCECNVCDAFDPTTGECVPPFETKQDPLFQCSLDQAHVDETILETEFRTQCELGNTGNVRNCHLVNLDGDTCPSNKCSPRVTVQDGDHNCVTASRVVPTTPPAFWSQATIESGTIQIHSPDGSGTTSLSGSLAFIGGNCDTGTCSLDLVDTSLDGTSFQIAGRTAANPFAFNSTLGTGFLFGDHGIFMINAAGFEVVATARVSGDQTGFVASADAAGVGLINQRDRQLVFAQSFVSGDATLDIQLSAAIQNLLPTVALTSASTIECNAPGGSNVSLTAALSDVDGRIVASRWFVDGQFLAVDTSSVTTFLSLGSHVVHIDVADNDGGPGFVEETVEVEDTTPPALTLDAVCLWPPNHDLYVIDPSMLGAVDVCDPSAAIEFLHGTSNQPDDGLGDGHTTNDLVVRPDAICARAERDGRELAGRVYTIDARATDASGNTSDVSFTVDVAHDQSTKCDVRAGEPVADGDPRCVPQLQSAKLAAGGCNASGESSGGLLVLLFVVGTLVWRRRRHAALLVVAAAGGCVIPPDLEVAMPDTRWEALCVCQVCVVFDPTTGACVDFEPDPSPLFACDLDSENVDEQALEEEFRTECHLGSVPPDQLCELQVLDAPDTCPRMTSCSEFVVLQERDHNCTTSARVAPPQGPSSWSTANVESGTLQISSTEGNGTASLSGRLDFIGGNCVTGTCPFDLVDLSLSAGDFSLAGSTVRDPFVINTTLGVGSLFGDAGVFMINANTLTVVASGTVSGSRRGVMSSNDLPGVGLIVQEARQLVFAQTLFAGDTIVDIQVAAAIDNLRPTVTLSSGSTIECNAFGGANVTLTAAMNDADGRVTASRWFVDGQFAGANTSHVTTFLALGSHTVHIDVVDNDGGPAALDATVLVQDTTPPSLDVGALCLWPPNHDLYVVDPSMLGVLDACDPAPSVTFLQGTSNQADNGLGDGNTTGDLVVRPDAVCARAERDGRLLDGRAYNIDATVVDAAGNASNVSFAIEVPHDQSTKCDAKAGEPVDDFDPRCIPELHAVRPTSGGCDASHPQGFPSGICLLAGLAFLIRRRMKTRAS